MINYFNKIYGDTCCKSTVLTNVTLTLRLLLSVYWDGPIFKNFCCASLLTCMANVLVFSLCTLVVQCPDSSFQKLIQKPGFTLMSGSCHLDRASNVKIGVECQIFVIVIFFNCSQVLQFGAHSRYYKGALTQKR